MEFLLLWNTVILLAMAVMQHRLHCLIAQQCLSMRFLIPSNAYNITSFLLLPIHSVLLYTTTLKHARYSSIIACDINIIVIRETSLQWLLITLGYHTACMMIHRPCHTPTRHATSRKQTCGCISALTITVPIATMEEAGMVYLQVAFPVVLVPNTLVIKVTWVNHTLNLVGIYFFFCFLITSCSFLQMYADIQCQSCNRTSLLLKQKVPR